MKSKILIFIFFVFNWSACIADEPIVLECTLNDGSWWGNIEIDLKNEKLSYDNVIERMMFEGTENLREIIGRQNKNEYLKKQFNPPEFLIIKISSTEIRAALTRNGEVVKGTNQRELFINRYTLTLSDSTEKEKFKCNKKSKGF